MTRLLINPEQIRTFASAIFKHGSDDQIVSLRTFPDGNQQQAALQIQPVKINGAGLEPVIEAAIEQAQWAADHSKKAVFCPPLAGFSSAVRADETHLSEGYTLSVECDQHPTEARGKLEQILGPATLVVASGGLWTDRNTGEVQEKLHLHWRLNEPATGDDRNLLKQARRSAAVLVGADTTTVSIVHPMRWPGSWHVKGEPRLARIVSLTENELDLRDAIDRLEPFRTDEPKGSPGSTDEPRYNDRQDKRSTAELIANITTGREFHPSTVPLSSRWIGAGMKPGAVVNQIRDLMEAVPHDQRDFRWQSRFDSIPQIVATAEGKFGAKETGNPKAALIKSSLEFVKDFVPPDYLWDGILQRRFCYSLTGQTGGGKTAIALRLAASTALGLSIAGRQAERGRVLYFAGENPDDVQMRWIAMAEHMGFDIDTIDVHFIPGVFSIDELEERVRAEVNALGGVALVIVDTSAAYFPGDSENDNVQYGAHARRMRRLTTLQGGPTVLVLCHPVKNAAADNLLPRGGSAFLAEVDGNLTALRNETLSTVHWQGKFRGPDFERMSFEMCTVTANRLKDSKGRNVPTVIAKPLSEAEQQERVAVIERNEDAVLVFLLEREESGTTGTVSYSGVADALGWQRSTGIPAKSKVERAFRKLRDAKLIITVHRDHELTDRGRKAAKRLAYNKLAAGASYA